jgi:hypothetical protein
VADFEWPGALPPEEDRPDLADEQLMEHNAYFNPGGLSGAGVVNTTSWREAELPSTNGHGSARGVARVYAALAAGGAIDGVMIVGRWDTALGLSVTSGRAARSASVTRTWASRSATLPGRWARDGRTRGTAR